MDDIFEVLIYVLFIGASIAGGIYKNYVKKKEEERLRQKKIQNAQNSNSYAPDVEPEPSRSPIPTTLEDFLKRQFEIETEPQPSEYELESELIDEDTSQIEIVSKEGVAAFKETSDALLSDNLNDSDFSISTELDKQDESKIISDEETQAFNNSEDDNDHFDLKEAIIYSEILKRPYQ